MSMNSIRLALTPEDRALLQRGTPSTITRMPHTVNSKYIIACMSVIIQESKSLSRKKYKNYIIFYNVYMIISYIIKSY